MGQNESTIQEYKQLCQEYQSLYSDYNLMEDELTNFVSAFRNLRGINSKRKRVGTMSVSFCFLLTST